MACRVITTANCISNAYFTSATRIHVLLRDVCWNASVLWLLSIPSEYVVYDCLCFELNTLVLTWPISFFFLHDFYVFSAPRLSLSVLRSCFGLHLLLTFDLQMNCMHRSWSTRLSARSWTMPSMTWPLYRQLFRNLCTVSSLAVLYWLLCCSGIFKHGPFPLLSVPYSLSSCRAAIKAWFSYAYSNLSLFAFLKRFNTYRNILQMIQTTCYCCIH